MINQQTIIKRKKEQIVKEEILTYAQHLVESTILTAKKELQKCKIKNLKKSTGLKKEKDRTETYEKSDVIKDILLNIINIVVEREKNVHESKHLCTKEKNPAKSKKSEQVLFAKNCNSKQNTVSHCASQELISKNSTRKSNKRSQKYKSLKQSDLLSITNKSCDSNTVLDHNYKRNKDIIISHKTNRIIVNEEVSMSESSEHGLSEKNHDKTNVKPDACFDEKEGNKQELLSSSFTKEFQSKKYIQKNSRIDRNCPEVHKSNSSKTRHKQKEETKDNELVVQDQNVLGCDNIIFSSNNKYHPDSLLLASDISLKEAFESTSDSHLSHRKLNFKRADSSKDASHPEGENTVRYQENKNLRAENQKQQPTNSQSSHTSYNINSDMLIRENELELNKLHELQSDSSFRVNQSIYKLAYDENITDQSESDEPLSLSSLSKQSSLLSAVNRDLRNDKTERAEILVHEADSGSEAGSEDVELFPRRYEGSQNENKHVYVNNLSLAVEMLRTHEALPYDEEFKRVVGNEGEDGNKRNSPPKSYYTGTGSVNPAFIDDAYHPVAPTKHCVISTDVRGKTRYSDIFTFTDVTEDFSYSQVHGREIHTSTADSGVQSEDSGDDLGEENGEPCGKLRFNENEEHNDCHVAQDNAASYRRFGAQARQRLNILEPRSGMLNPCFCCIIM